MTRFPRVSAAALAAALAAAAAPALAAEVVELSTASTTRGYYPPGYYAAPVIDHSVIVGDTYYDERPIIVTAPRATDDVLITDDVVDRLATDPRVSGNIGVDAFRGDVTLTGRVGGTVQKDYAEQDAKSVDGVNEVENHIRPRVGEM